MTEDGLLFYYNSLRPSPNSKCNIWVSKRKTISAEWEEPKNLGLDYLSNANTPVLSADGLILLFASGDARGFGSSDIWMSMRKTMEDDWSIPINLGPDVNTKTVERPCSISSDGLVLIFGSYLSEKKGVYVLWVTTRESRQGPFGKRRTLGAMMNRWETAGGGSLSHGGNTLIFHSNHRGGRGSWDLWVANLK